VRHHVIACGRAQLLHARSGRRKSVGRKANAAVGFAPQARRHAACNRPAM